MKLASEQTVMSYCTNIILLYLVVTGNEDLECLMYSLWQLHKQSHISDRHLCNTPCILDMYALFTKPHINYGVVWSVRIIKCVWCLVVLLWTWLTSCSCVTFFQYLNMKLSVTVVSLPPHGCSQFLAQRYKIPEQQYCDPGGHWWRW